MKMQGWGKRFIVKPYGTSYTHYNLEWLGKTAHGLPRLGWYLASQWLS